MTNRTGTYVAFDGLGKSDPTQSDFKYYATIQAWCRNKNIEFNLTNSHDKAYAVKDSSTKQTLHASIQQRLRASKNMLIILTSDTRYTGSELSYEIEQAIDNYKLPLIIAYPGYTSILNVESHKTVWPKALVDRINSPGTKAIHVAFNRECILDAISQFTVNNNTLTNGKNKYSRETYKKWGLIL